MYVFRSLSLLFLTVAACTSPPQGGEDVRISVLDGFIREALFHGRAYDRLEELCTVAPHRLSASTDAAAAIEWARATMEKEGFENIRLEPCVIPRWVRGATEQLFVVEPKEHAGERLAILALGGSIATPPAGLEADVIQVQNFEELTRRAEEARGKLVLFNRPMDSRLVDPFQAYRGAVNQRAIGASKAAAVGAVGAICRSMTTRLDNVPHTGGMRYAKRVPRIPSAACSTEAAERIAGWIDAGKRVRLRMVLNCREEDPVGSFNVIGELTGWEKPEEIVVVGGHLDAWDVGQGAHDDGAGCVQSIEAVSLVMRLDQRPRRTLRCVLFMNEENGTGGARAYAAAHGAEHHVLAIESDRGGFTPRGFTSDARGEVFDILQSLVELQKRTGAEKLISGGGGVDISPLAASHVPLVGYLPDAQRYFDLHHSASDTLDEVNERELALGAAAIASLAWLVADLPETLPPNPPR
ncbi:MAG: peptidase M28 family protein [Planctomycetes bacterium]|jgi:hypothetical protein|nr:peptidase M28 family protein [Planctomycetota bacterium]